MRLLYILIFLTLLIILFFVTGLQGCEQKECSINTDCAKIQITCCPCNTGGTEKCISKTLVSIYQKELEKCPEPKDLLCTDVDNCEKGNCSCVDDKCVIVKD